MDTMCSRALSNGRCVVLLRRDIDLVASSVSELVTAYIERWPQLVRCTYALRFEESPGAGAILQCKGSRMISSHVIYHQWLIICASFRRHLAPACRQDGMHPTVWNTTSVGLSLGM